jgi:CMP-N-acetylneuraminic acid synthetase
MEKRLLKENYVISTNIPVATKFKALSNIAVIPARYGSKRIPQKNFKFLGGKPLLAYTIEQALRSRYLQLIVISTDFADIEQFLHGYDRSKILLHMRPEVLAGDLVTTEEVLLNVLDQEWAKGVEYIVTLPPTTPFRSAETIDKCIELFLNKKADSVLAISRAKIRMGPFDPQTQKFSLAMKNPPSKMSEWPLTFFDNSSVYVTKSIVLREKKFILGQKNYAVETDKIQGHDINDPVDWAFAESLIEKGFVK